MVYHMLYLTVLVFICRFIYFVLETVLAKRGVKLMTALSCIRLGSYDKFIWRQAS